MSKQFVHIQHQFSAPLSAVFEHFADHEKFGLIWPGKTRRVKDGDSETNGLGSVREITVGPSRFEETIVSFERPHRIDYTITKGSPLKNHHGCLRFSGDENSCELDYRIEFEGRLPFIAAIVAAKLPKDFKRGVLGVEQVLREGANGQN